MNAVILIRAWPLAARRVFALGILAVGIALILGVVVAPIERTLQTLAAERTSAYARLAHERALAIKTQDFEAALKALQDSPVWTKLLPPDSRSGAEAALQASVRGALKDAPVQALEPLEPLARPGLTELGVRVQTQMTIDRLRAFIEQLETGPQLLRLRALTVSAPPVQATAENPLLTVRADVIGWMPKRAGS